MSEFYFPFPRLLAKWSGRETVRSERNWLEAISVGILVHLVAYAFAFERFLLSSTLTWQLLLFIPLAFLVWVFWMIVLYLNSLLIKLLRAGGLLGMMPDRGAQGLIICTMNTGFAWQLVRAESWPRVVGLLWMAAVALNLLAALLLAVTHGADPAVK